MFGQFRRSPRRPDWSRANADPDDLWEYDAFGPWLLPVGSAAEMPRRFRPAYDGLKHADHIIKTPRSIDRNETRPGADLYGAVFAVDADGFTLLLGPADAEGFTSREVAWDEVAAVRQLNNLLHAEFSLLLKDGDTLTVPYRSVSTDMMTRIVSFARRRLVDPDEVRPLPSDEAEEFEDFFFNAILAEERHGGQFMLPIHFDPPGQPCRNARNQRRVTTGTLILLSGSELVIVDRAAPMRRRFFAHYAYRKTYVCLPAVKAFRLLPPPDGGPGGFMVLELIIDQQRIGIPSFKSPDRLIDMLCRRGIARL